MPYLTRTHRPTLHYRIDYYTALWKNAPVVLLQHGYARSSLFWYAWVPHLARDYKVLRIDLRGHGESLRDFDPATGSTLDAYLGDIRDVLDHLGLERVHYCGESFGGILGMVLAAEEPQRVRTLTLVASPVYQNANAAYSAGFATREEALRTLGTRKWAEAIYGAPGFFPPGTDPRLRDWYVGEIAKNDPEVLCGLYGLVKHASAANLLRSGIRDFELVHMLTSSHAVLTVEPDACAARLLDFLHHRGKP
jgi:3-oxoadipate enol-lactonase